METEPLLAEYLTEETAADELNVSTRTLSGAGATSAGGRRSRTSGVASFIIG